MRTSAIIETAQQLPTILTGREYLRVSVDKWGRQRSVTEQHKDNERGAALHNVSIVGEPYIDNDISASRYSEKEREDFERLIADLEIDNFPEDMLVVWEISRGSRRTGEWVRLIELLELRGKLIFVTTHGRIYDPANGRDRRTLLEEAVDSEYESYKISERIKRDTAAQARLGRPHGGPPHGYKAVYNERTRELINWEENAEESDPPKELFRRLHAGDALSAIEKDFEQAGYLNRSGKPFSRQHLRTMATRHAYAGLRVHRPQGRGQRPSEEEPAITKASWKGLVEAHVFWAVQRIISNPKRRKSKNGKAKHVLTAALICDKCGSGVSVKRPDSEEVYRCVRSCTYVQKAGVDDLLIGTAQQPGAILRYLASPAVYSDFGRTPQQEERAQAVLTELEKTRAELAKMENAEPESLEAATMIARGIKRLKGKVSDLEAEERDLTLPSTLRDLINPGADVATRWEAASVAARRQVAQLVLSPTALGEVRLTPCAVKRRLPSKDRLRFVRAV